MSTASSTAPPSFQDVARHGSKTSSRNGGIYRRPSLRTGSMGPTAGAPLDNHSRRRPDVYCCKSSVLLLRETYDAFLIFGCHLTHHLTSQRSGIGRRPWSRHIFLADAGQLSQAEQLVKSTLAEAGNPKQMWTFSSSGWLFVYFFGKAGLRFLMKNCPRPVRAHHPSPSRSLPPRLGHGPFLFPRRRRVMTES